MAMLNVKKFDLSHFDQNYISVCIYLSLSTISMSLPLVQLHGSATLNYLEVLLIIGLSFSADRRDLRARHIFASKIYITIAFAILYRNVQYLEEDCLYLL